VSLKRIFPQLCSDARQRYPTLAETIEEPLVDIAKKILLLAKLEKVPALKHYLPLLDGIDSSIGYKGGVYQLTVEACFSFYCLFLSI
jgi:hypothetical protein